MASVRNPVVAPATIRQRWDMHALVGAGLIFVAGQIHLVLTPAHFEEAPYLGLLFVADFAIVAAAAIGLYLGRRWVWTLGVLVAGGAFVAYFAAGTVGLLGMGAVAKAVEALFLVLVALKLPGAFTGFRRWVLVGGMVVVLVAPVLALALGLLSPDGARANSGLPITWRATSPATELGDRYNLIVTNTGDEAQQVGVEAIIGHTDTALINEQLRLAPGEERELTAINDYGSAPHIVTRLGSETRNVDLSVRFVDSSGEETALYNQDAFLVRQGKAGGKANGG